MINIVLNDIVLNSSSNSEGTKLYNALNNAYLKKQTILLNIDNQASLSSSFLNTSIGAFLDKYGLQVFKSTVKFNGTKSQFLKLSNYITKYSELYLA